MSQFDNILNKKAVALSYNEKKDIAPVIVASGMGYLAEKIVEVARENNVPVYEDNSLSTILTQLELGSPIPNEVYEAVVGIYVYFLNYNNQNKQTPITSQNLKNENTQDEEIIEDTDENLEEDNI